MIGTAKTDLPECLNAVCSGDARSVTQATPLAISVIIPCLDEEQHIGELLNYLQFNDRFGHIAEIIVADGGSTDGTAAIAESRGAKVIRCPHKGRAVQMNIGAHTARGDVLYFLHADCLPPPRYAEDIVATVTEGIESGCYRLSFDEAHWFLRANCWFTRFDLDSVRFGDQSLFVTKEVFERIGGFDGAMLVMEDQEIIVRLKQCASFQVLQSSITTSARKYLENGIFKLQLIFFVIYTLYKIGCSQTVLVRVYRSQIRQNKL